jgi:L-asparaginase/beta-aspartyl-peptidase (threonine type)
VGSPADWSPDCQAAADTALTALRGGTSALDAAVGGTQVMENIHRFNAGTGANIRLDGKSIQMDAAVMTSEGRFGAVAVIERVLHPVAVARAVLGTPHLLLAGEGATRFAHAAGFKDAVPTCDEAEAKFKKRAAALLEHKTGDPAFDTFDWRRFWNFPNPIPPELGGPGKGGPRGGAAGGRGARGGGGGAATAPASAPALWLGDTVGTVCRDGDGRFAATLSTGGTSITLYGRVGDVPIMGAGLFAGPAGAVACTGFGEMIIREAEARTVYNLMAGGLSARDAVRRGCQAFPESADLGVIAVGRDGWGVAANRSMAYGHAWAARPVKASPPPGS